MTEIQSVFFMDFPGNENKNITTILSKKRKEKKFFEKFQ